MERNRKVDPHQCIFSRSVVKHRVLDPEPVDGATATRPRANSLNAPVFDVLVAEVERLLSKSLEAIDVAMSDSRLKVFLFYISYFVILISLNFSVFAHLI